VPASRLQSCSSPTRTPSGPHCGIARRETLWAIKALFSAALMHALIYRNGVFPNMAFWKSLAGIRRSER
jgi:hypothetical protein